MAHLSDEQLLLFVRHQADPDAQEHVAACDQCAKGAELWKSALGVLPRVVRETVTRSEMHHLQTMFRHHGPERRSAATWIAALVRSAADPVAAAVRGGAMADLYEYKAGPYSLMVGSGPMDGGAFPVHGQVFHSADRPLGEATIVIADDAGTGFVEPIDEFGEFHVDVTVPGLYSVTVLTDEGSFRVDGFSVGESGRG